MDPEQLNFLLAQQLQMEEDERFIFNSKTLQKMFIEQYLRMNNEQGEVEVLTLTV